MPISCILYSTILCPKGEISKTSQANISTDLLIYIYKIGV